MARFTANTTHESGTVTPPSCPTPVDRDQDPFGLPRAPIVSAALSASVPIPRAPAFWEKAA